MELVEKFKQSLSTITENENGGFEYDNGRMVHLFFNDPDFLILQEKMEKFVKMMEEENKKGNLESFLDRDIETDIWLIL